MHSVGAASAPGRSPPGVAPRTPSGPPPPRSASEPSSRVSAWPGGTGLPEEPPRARPPAPGVPSLPPRKGRLRLRPSREGVPRSRHRSRPEFCLSTARPLGSLRHQLRRPAELQRPASQLVTPALSCRSVASAASQPPSAAVAMAGGGVPGSGASGGEQPGGGVDYRGAVCLAPMVRVGTLPMRMLAAQHGATLTYSEELIALRLQRCVRKPNAAHGTVDCVDP